MANDDQLDRTYHFILKTIIETGQAPHYTEIAREFSAPVEKGLEFLHDLMRLPLPNWLFPETDMIASFAPFNNMPTPYRITVKGEQRWFAQ